MRDQHATPGVVIGEPAPNGAPVSTGLFTALAREEACAGTRNRLFVIDGMQVFWDRAGNCGDNSYAQRLFGATPDALLCETMDSIAGPRTSCKDEASRGLFNTILANLDRDDLGLGKGHKVEALAFLPQNGASIAFAPLVEDAYSGIHAARNVVIRDAAAYARLWAEHANGRSPAPEMPRVNFSTHMLAGVFSGNGPNGCRRIQVTKVISGADNIVVSYEERNLATFAICTEAASAPMQLVAIPRSEAAVNFVSITPVHQMYRELDRSTRSMIAQPRNVVVKDAAGFSALWAEHSGNASPAPDIDFSRSMVIGVFAGTRSNGCYSNEITDIYRENGKLTVVHTEWQPGAGAACTMALVNPAHLVVVPRSDDPVEFSAQVRVLK
ncbi:MAG: protease complex subunit PrcB family protein [Telluria sp.]